MCDSYTLQYFLATHHLRLDSTSLQTIHQTMKNNLSKINYLFEFTHLAKKYMTSARNIHSIFITTSE